MGKKGKNIFWNFWDNIQGDTVIWIIVTMLILFSIVCIFSSTTMLATASNTRMDIFGEQMIMVVIGVLFIFGLYFVRQIGFFRFFSQFGFIISLIVLILLFSPLKVTVNGATRAFRLPGFTVQSYEVVKVAMVMYLSWAVYAYKKDSFTIVNYLSRKYKALSFLKGKGWKRIIYMYIPILTVCAFILVGSFSSAAFIGMIMILTVLIGGAKFKDMLLLGCLLAVAGGLFLTVNHAADYSLLPRQETWEARAESFFRGEKTDNLDNLKKGSIEHQREIDKRRQIDGAKIAIHEGGLFGKGAGKSDQKYAVPLIFSDFMFSFIIEEFGLFAAIILIILYVSLLARGSLIVRNCENEFAKTAVAGLCLLISSQAMMHMFINTGLFPLTGQTLPMISHGNTSFICFSIAFGILLSISRMTKKKMDRAAKNAPPLIVSDDDIRNGLNDLDVLDSM